MNAPLTLSKFTLIITTRCNLNCRFCCEYVPQNKPGADMTIDAEKRILNAFFDAVDRVEILHLSGGGEPFLHPRLAEMIEVAMEYADHFDTLMVFTNSTIPVSAKLLNTLKKHSGKLVVHASDYHIFPAKEAAFFQMLEANGINHRIVKYYGDEQDFGGWVDFGEFKAHGRTPKALEDVFGNCAVTRDMRGNWRTSDGKVHWCSRSQRGLELGLVPVDSANYVDLFDPNSTRGEKREQFLKIMNTKYLTACDYCSGDQGTDNSSKRFSAAEQL
jgi:hypothetical protein